jgi:hypothetical protein
LGLTGQAQLLVVSKGPPALIENSKHTDEVSELVFVGQSANVIRVGLAYSDYLDKIHQQPFNKYRKPTSADGFQVSWRVLTRLVF